MHVTAVSLSQALVLNHVFVLEFLYTANHFFGMNLSHRCLLRSLASLLFTWEGHDICFDSARCISTACNLPLSISSVSILFFTREAFSRPTYIYSILPVKRAATKQPLSMLRFCCPAAAANMSLVKFVFAHITSAQKNVAGFKLILDCNIGPVNSVMPRLLQSVIKLWTSRIISGPTLQRYKNN